MRTPEGDALTDLILPIFQLDAEIMAAAETITDGHDISPAQWQVLGSTLHEPLSVPRIAQRLGHARQSVQRLANHLVAQGWAEWQANAHNQRSPLLAPTPAGRAAIDELHTGQHRWANRVGAHIGTAELITFHRTLRRIIGACVEYRRDISERSAESSG